MKRRNDGLKLVPGTTLGVGYNATADLHRLLIIQKFRRPRAPIAVSHAHVRLLLIRRSRDHPFEYYRRTDLVIVNPKEGAKQGCRRREKSLRLRSSPACSKPSWLAGAAAAKSRAGR
jgi:hypothetical protein